MSTKKKEVRAKFRTSVFSRAKYRCECCGVKGYDRQDVGEGIPLDAHHIVDRSEFKGGGYVTENGISVCDSCHLKAEAYHRNIDPESGFWPNELYQKIGSSYEAAVTADAKLL